MHKLLRNVLLAATLIHAYVAIAQTRIVGTLFEVSSDSGNAYLVATTHTQSHVPLELNAQVLDALSKSNLVAFETWAEGAIAQSRQQAFSSMTKRQEGALTDDISPELAARIAAQLARHGAQPIYWEVLNQTRVQFAPMLLAEMFASLRVVPDAGRKFRGLDEIFLNQARERGIPIGEVEGLLRRARVYLDVSAEESSAALAQMIDALERPDYQARAAADVREALDLVYSGDMTRVYSVARAKECDTAKLASRCNKILDGRNPIMADQIEAMVKQGKRPFVAVGALHLAGPASILFELEKKGFRVRRLDGAVLNQGAVSALHCLPDDVRK